MKVQANCLAVSLSLVLVACNKTEPPAPTPASPSASAAAVVASPSASAASAVAPGAEKPKAEKGKVEKASSAEIAAHKSYRQALTEGRKLTQQKKFAEAIAAFDRALSFEPNNPQALGERGYAKLLSGDLEQARLDLDAARKRPMDPKLLSTIEFNFGLLEEKRGDQAAARAHFAKANELRPSEAAKKKLSLVSDAPASSCGVTPSTSGTSTKTFGSWSEVYKTLHHKMDPDTASNSAAAAAALTADCAIDEWDNTFPAAGDESQCNVFADSGNARVIRYEDADGNDRLAVTAEGPDGITVWEDDGLIRHSLRCGPASQQILLRKEGSKLWLRVYSGEVLPVQLCTLPGNSEDIDVCDDKYTESFSSACGDVSWFSRYDALIDPSKGFVLRLDGWVTSGEGSKSPLAELGAATVKLSSSGAEISRGACSQSLPYR